MNTFQPEVNRRKLIKRYLRKCLFDLLKSHCGQKTDENSNLTNFGCIRSIHSRNLVHSKTAWKEHILPEMDRGKSMKLCLDNRFSWFLHANQVWPWTENNNLISFWCIQGGNLMHSNPAKHDHISAKKDWGKLIKLCCDDCLLDFYEAMVDRK